MYICVNTSESSGLTFYHGRTDGRLPGSDGRPFICSMNRDGVVETVGNLRKATNRVYKVTVDPHGSHVIYATDTAHLAELKRAAGAGVQDSLLNPKRIMANPGVYRDANVLRRIAESFHPTVVVTRDGAVVFNVAFPDVKMVDVTKKLRGIYGNDVTELRKEGEFPLLDIWDKSDLRKTLIKHVPFLNLRGKRPFLKRSN